MRFFELFETVLSQHRSIAFDFDGTIVDGKHSHDIQDYILNNPTHTFFIITHRTRAQGTSIPGELERVGLSTSLFKQIITCPDRLDFEFQQDIAQRRSLREPPVDRIPARQMSQSEYRYVHWKGFAAKRVGASLMVDDLRWLAEPGCRAYNITFMDAARFPHMAIKRAA